jgi:hypothetical protein
VDRIWPKAQMGNGDGAGFLGVVHEIALRIEIGFLADDLDGVLVGADGAVRAQSEEEGAHHLFRVPSSNAASKSQGGVGDVVHNANR